MAYDEVKEFISDLVNLARTHYSRTHRFGEKLTQRQFAKEIKLPYGSYQAWERGEVVPSVPGIALVTWAAGKSVDQVMYDLYVIQNKEKPPVMPPIAGTGMDLSSCLDVLLRNIDALSDEDLAKLSLHVGSAQFKRIQEKAEQSP